MTKSAFVRCKVVWERMCLSSSASIDPTARMLCILLWLLLPIYVIHATVGMLLTGWEGPYILLVSFVNALLVLSPIASLILVRNAFVALAGGVFLVGVWLSYTLIILFNGGIHHVGLAVYIALPVCAAWLFGYKAARLIAAACFGSATAMAVLETIGIGPLHYFQGRPIGIWFMLLECTVMGVVPVSMVLTSLRRALAQSQLAQAELRRTQEANLNRQKLESLGVLAAGIAHDFNNLLGSIIASSELEIHSLSEGTPVRETLEIIRSIASRGTEIVHELMIYAGQESSTFEEVDLSELVREMLQLLAVSISKTVALKIDLPGTVPLIRANPAQIRQLVMNLIMNASDALKERSGEISLSLRQADPPDSGQAQSSRSWLQLTVRDSGCGMTDEILARIFDPFFTTKGIGRGLGLAAVRGIVDSHGGTIRVSSRPGEGSTFEVLLPCMNQTQAEAHYDAAPASSDGALLGTILMIDDETQRRPMAQLLRATGISVVEASDGAIAIQAVRENANRIQAILLEPNLPGVSTSVLVELRRVLPGVPVILTSRYTRDRIAAEICEGTGVLYLQKPYGLGRLLEILQNITQQDAEARRAGAG